MTTDLELLHQDEDHHIRTPAGIRIQVGRSAQRGQGIGDVPEETDAG